ncbi:MAG: serine/threonine protein kinase [Caldilineae bacterium]|nr:serine/threonine protein kinase [Chloroflexota bacterium]MCB9176431.1 serine/threonine protein kinase [Caldilineae bacterium]
MSETIKPGTVLRGRYRVVELVGQGGAGAVYRAEDLRLPGRVTAVKEIRPEPGSSAEQRSQAQDQFRREASTLARLDHPGLPKVSDYFVREDVDFLVMDFVEGPDLRQLVEEARARGEFLPEAQVLDWASQLVEVVRYLHGQAPPVLHRDIKPANIKLVDGTRIKLVDFGLVKPMDPQDPRTLTVARGLGSLPYTPLEQYAGDTGHTDVRADIYGIGATLYHLLTGRLPVTAQERFLMPNALARPRRLNPDISARVEGSILVAMALHPDKRPDSVEALGSLLAGTEPLMLDGEMGTAPAAWRAALWENAALLALVLLLTVLASLATWESVRQHAEPGGAPTPVSAGAP